MKIGNYSNQNNYAVNNQNKDLAFGVYAPKRNPKIAMSEVEDLIDISKEINIKSIVNELISKYKNAIQSLTMGKEKDSLKKLLPGYKGNAPIIVSKKDNGHSAELVYAGISQRAYGETEEQAVKNLLDKTMETQIRQLSKPATAGIEYSPRVRKFETVY